MQMLYENQTADWLRCLAKEYGLPRYVGKSRIKKEILLASILEYENNSKYLQELHRSIEMSEKGKESKVAYLQTVPTGTLVAFVVNNNKAKSAKIIARYPKEHKLEVETEYGLKMTIAFEDVLWVKTGQRWPKGIYRLLKGMEAVD